MIPRKEDTAIPFSPIVPGGRVEAGRIFWKPGEHGLRMTIANTGRRPDLERPFQFPCPPISAVEEMVGALVGFEWVPTKFPTGSPNL